MGYQCVIICGNLGKDPEMKYLPDGTAVTTFSVAVNRKTKDREEVEWFSVVLWSALAETAGQYLQKGREVLIQGEMKTRNWMGQDNVKHYRTELVGRTMQFVGAKREGDYLPGHNEPLAPDEVPFEN